MKLHENIPCHPVNTNNSSSKSGRAFVFSAGNMRCSTDLKAVCFQPEFPSTQDDEAARKRYLDHLRFGGTTIFLFRFFCGYGRWLWNHMMMRRNTKLMNMLVVVMVMVIMPALLKQRYRVIGDPELLFNVFFFKIVFRGEKINLRKALSKRLIFLPLGSLFCWIMLVYWKKVMAYLSCQAAKPSLQDGP